jgi:hypothetical protein
MFMFKFNDSSDNKINYFNNCTFKKIFIGFVVTCFLCFISCSNSKIEKEIDHFELNNSFQDFSSIIKTSELIASEINLIDSENHQQIKVLSDKLNKVTSKKIFNLMQVKFDQLKKEKDNFKECEDLLNDFNSNKGFIKDEQYLSFFNVLLAELNIKIKNEKFRKVFNDKKKEFIIEIKELVEIQWREYKYVGGCEANHYDFTSGNIKYEDFYPTSEIDEEDHKKVVMKFTYIFKSKIKHRFWKITPGSTCGNGDFDGDYNVTAKGQICLEGDSNNLIPNFQPVGNIIWEAKRVK